MALVDNPRKEFHFGVYIPGMNPFLAQKAKLPDIDFEIAEHGEGGLLIKTPGIKKVGRFQLDKLGKIDEPDLLTKTWIALIQSGAPASVYKKPILVEHYGYDNITVIDRWTLVGAFPAKVNGKNFDAKSSENQMESIEFEIDDIV